MAYPPPGYGHRDLRSCGFHARDQAYRYASPGARRRWRRFARRGAALQRAQHSVPSLKARAQRERDYAYSDAFDDCMRGFRR
jgi:hypothetical protein